jgi:hypothetical protein
MTNENVTRLGIELAKQIIRQHFENDQRNLASLSDLRCECRLCSIARQLLAEEKL